MSLVAKSQPNLADPPPSSLQFKPSPSPLMKLVLIAENLHALSQSWKAMNAGDDSPSWQTRWRRATSSLETLRALSEPSPT